MLNGFSQHAPAHVQRHANVKLGTWPAIPCIGPYRSSIDTQLVDHKFSCSRDNPSTSPILGLRASDGAFEDENCIVSIRYTTTVAFEVGGIHPKVGVATAE